jgi:hypothetical protein
LAAAVATLLILGALAAATPAVASTSTLSPAEESAIPSADPSHIIPDQILVQFSRPVSSAELTGFETRFRLTYMSDLEIGDDRPYYQFHIDDGMNPPDKRVQILAGEPLVSWCGPNIRVELEAGQPASNQSPTGSPSSTASPSATAPLASSAPTSSARPGGPANSDPASSLPLAATALIAVIAAVACLALAAVFVRRRRRAA